MNNIALEKEFSPEVYALLTTIRTAATTLEQPTYLVGGYVRDFFIHQFFKEGSTERKDLDFVTVGSGIDLATHVAQLLGTSHVSTFKKFGTAHISYKGFDLEFVGARKESYTPDSRKPVVENGTLLDDQLRRDFTINALSCSLNEEDWGTVLDPFDGLSDLQSRIIRTPVDPERTFSDDPLRMLRAIRFATTLHFDIEPDTFQAIQRMADRLSIISKERIASEVNKMILASKPSIGFALLFHANLLEHFFPELKRLHGIEVRNGMKHKDNFWHTLEVLDNVSDYSSNLWLRWSALLHDIAKPPTKRFDPTHGWTFHGHEALGAKWVPKIFRRLGLPLDDRMKYVKKLVRLHLRPIALANEVVTDSAVRRLIFEAGDDIDDLMTLCRADITSKNERKVQRYLRNFDHVEQKIAEVEAKDHLRNWQPPVDGNEIMTTLHLKPGREVGIIKKAIEEAILNGEIPNEHDAAFEYMLTIKDQLLSS